MEDEEAAHARLLENLTTYPAEAKAHCVDQTKHVEDQSYVEMLECLHLTLGLEPLTPIFQGAKKRK